jgi:hypothetical protein
MVWERFHHICRRSIAPLRPGESLAVRIKAADADPDTAFYGARLKPGTLPRRILDRIIAHSGQDRARRMLEFYASLNLERETTHSLQLNRVAIYLARVAVLFVVLYGIYRFLITPEFPALFETIQVQTPSLVALFREYDWAFAMLIVLLLALALMMGHALRALADWPSSRGRSGLTRFLASPGARAAYADLDAAVLFPLGPDAVDGKSKVTSHLWKLEEEGVDIRDEIAALVRCRHRTLIELCEKQMCLMYTFCVLLVVLMIVLFLAGGHSPTAVLP